LEEFQDRHELSFPASDSGHISLDEYLDRTLFYRTAVVLPAKVHGVYVPQSKEFPQSRAILKPGGAYR